MQLSQRLSGFRNQAIIELSSRNQFELPQWLLPKRNSFQKVDLQFGCTEYNNSLIVEMQKITGMKEHTV